MCPSLDCGILPLLMDWSSLLRISSSLLWLLVVPASLVDFLVFELGEASGALYGVVEMFLRRRFAGVVGPLPSEVLKVVVLCMFSSWSAVK